MRTSACGSRRSESRRSRCRAWEPLLEPAASSSDASLSSSPGGRQGRWKRGVSHAARCRAAQNSAGHYTHLVAMAAAKYPVRARAVQARTPTVVNPFGGGVRSARPTCGCSNGREEPRGETIDACARPILTSVFAGQEEGEAGPWRPPGDSRGFYFRVSQLQDGTHLFCSSSFKVRSAPVRPLA